MSTLDLTGISETECASGCSGDGCVISGKSYCAHPCKAGLAVDDRADRDVQHRYSAARRELGLPAQKEVI